MGKGIFGKWFREFATLVLTQTVQAFLLAIVMTIIISCLSNSDGSNNANNAAGLLAIIALASFNKIEMLVKNIFGVTSGFGDPSLQNAKGLTAGSMLAFRGIRNISDNASKFVQGRRLQKEGYAGLKSLGTSGGELNADRLNSNNKSLDGDDTEKKDLGGTVGQQVEEQVVKLQTMGDINALTQAIQRLTSATETSNKTDTNSKMKEYQEKINEGKKMQRSAVHESIGASIGATAGMIGGLAAGDNVAQNMLSGAGIGDDLGKANANRIDKKIDYKSNMKDINKQIKANQGAIDNFKKQVSSNVSSGKVDNVAEYNKMAAEAINQYRDNLSKNSKLASDSIKKTMKNPTDKIPMSRAKRNLKQIQKNLDSQTKADS